jgi:acetyl esterase
MIDPAIARLLDTYFRAPPNPGPPDVNALRAAAEQAPQDLGGVPEAVGAVRDARVAGSAGEIGVRVFVPAGDAPRPIVLYAHGGGWVTGSLDSHDRLCRRLANRLAACVVAVDYRRAPEHAYPAALDDVESAWHWVRHHAHDLGGDGTLAVAGDSSGATLVAALALRLRDADTPQPAWQMLLYPALDAGTAGASYAEFAAGFGLTAALMRWYWDTYRAGAAPDDGELSPLAARDLTALAPAVIAVADADVLRDDGIAYARRLEGAAVPVRLLRCSGMIHGFLRWAGAVPAARDWLDRIAAAARL